MEEEIQKLVKAIETCNQWNGESGGAKDFRDKTLEEFVTYKVAVYRNELYQTIRDVENNR